MKIGVKTSGERSALSMTLSFLSALLVLFTCECDGLACLMKNRTASITCDSVRLSNGNTFYACALQNLTSTTAGSTFSAAAGLAEIVRRGAGGREEIDQILNIFADVTKALGNSVSEEKEPRKKREKARHLQNVIIKMAEILFSSSVTSALEKLEPEKRNKIVGKLFDTFEISGPLIASTLLPGETETTSKGHVEMLLANVDVYALGRDAGFTVASNSFSFKKTSLVKLSAGQNTLGLSSALFTGAVNLLTPHDAANGTIPLMKPTGIIGYSRMNTHILMISLNMKKRNGDILLSENVTITMELQTQGLSSPVCYSMHPLTAELTSEGCTAQPINATHAACSCNHLTSFAILMSVTKSAEEPDLVLDIVSYVSCSLSILFFLLSFITFVSFDALKSDPSTIHANLVVCLGFGQLLFLLGIDRTQNKVRLKLRVHVGGVTAKIGNKENRNA